MECPSECSLDLLDAHRLFVFDDDERCLSPVERRIFPEVATWAAYLVHFSNTIFETIR